MTQETFRLADLAKLVGGELRGDGELMISGAAILRDAQEGELTLADHPRLAKELNASRAAAAIVNDEITEVDLPHLVVDDVHDAFAKIVRLFRQEHTVKTCGVSPAAHISPTATIAVGAVVYPHATIGDDVFVGPGCVIHPGVHLMAGCRLGNEVTIFPNAVLYENTVVGDRVIIHANAVLGAYGFGYRNVEGRHELSAQLGNVVLEDDVEVGACTTIDRGTYGPTSIGAGTKIDNQVMVAHNCRIGKHNLLCSQVGIAGSSSTGDYVVMAGQVGLRDHIHIGDRTVLGAKSGVMNNIPADCRYFGIPATPEREQLVKQAALSKLPVLRKEFKAMQKQVAALDPPQRREAA